MHWKIMIDESSSLIFLDCVITGTIKLSYWYTKIVICNRSPLLVKAKSMSAGLYTSPSLLIPLLTHTIHMSRFHIIHQYTGIPWCFLFRGALTETHHKNPVIIQALQLSLKTTTKPMSYFCSSLILVIFSAFYFHLENFLPSIEW